MDYDNLVSVALPTHPMTVLTMLTCNGTGVLCSTFKYAIQSVSKVVVGCATATSLKDCSNKVVYLA